MVSSSSEHSWAVGEKKCVTNNEYNKKKWCPKVKDVDSKFRNALIRSTLSN